MPRQSLQLCTAFLLATALLAGQLVADDVPSFERDIRPILKIHCLHCHGDDGQREGNLDLRLRRLIAEGGDSGSAIEPGKASDSRLIQRIAAGEMPPDNKLVPADKLDLLRRWIDAGAPTAQPEPEGTESSADISPIDREHWAFQPVRRPPLPSVTASDPIRSPVDTFLLAQLTVHGLGYSPPASREQLLRRATIDLCGLPPTPDEITSFLADTAPDAYERRLDNLLSSPRYGERWGRHWLDVAGYADSDGYTVEDPIRPHAFRYRDYVIRRFNADHPFDAFIREQLAGDELVTPPYQDLSPDGIDSLAATGFLRTTPDGTAEDPDPKTARNAVVAETIKVVSSSVLGLTVGCAQCHSHKFDPISQEDYYRFRALFEPALDWKNWRPPDQRLISLYTAADRQRAQELEAAAAAIDAEHQQRRDELIDQVLQRELAKLPDEQREAARTARATVAGERTPEQLAVLKTYPSLNVDAGSLYLYDPKAAEELKKIAERAAAVRRQKPPEEFVSILSEIPGQLPETFVFHRGDPDQPRQPVAPGELRILEPSPVAAFLADDPALPTSGRRLAYARHLTTGRHPLVARVLVNRIWMHHFGRGLVATPADFGRQGERPSHPELLDWLADDFVSQGWSVKHLHRRIMTSTAYRQSSQRSPTLENLDPENRLLARMPVRRLEAEIVRDAVLSLGGQLNSRMFGPPIPVMQDADGQIVLGEERIDGSGVQLPPEPLHGEAYRRSVYIQQRRSRPLTVLDAFDLPAMEPNCEVRNSSTVAMQSLLLLNSEFVLRAADEFAARLERDCPHDLPAQVAAAWPLAYGRAGTEGELREAVKFITAQAKALAAPAADNSAATGTAPTAAHRALALFCQAILSSNEFLYVD